METSATKVNDLQSSAIVGELSMFDVCNGPGCSSGNLCYGRCVQSYQ